MGEAKRPVSCFGGDDGDPHTVTGYMCGVDFECELGAACGGNVVYPSVDDLKDNRGCSKTCGIVEVKVTAVRWVEPMQLGHGIAGNPDGEEVGGNG